VSFPTCSDSFSADIYNQPQSWPEVGPAVAAFVSGAAAPAPASTSSKASASAAPTSASSDSEPSPTYSETKPSSTKTKTSTKTASSTPTKGSKVCKRKAFVKKSSHHAKREYMRALGKKRM
jgi:hypothetical protein